MISLPSQRKQPQYVKKVKSMFNDAKLKFCAGKNFDFSLES